MDDGFAKIFDEEIDDSPSGVLADTTEPVTSNETVDTLSMSTHEELDEGDKKSTTIGYDYQSKVDELCD